MDVLTRQGRAVLLAAAMAIAAVCTPNAFAQGVAGSGTFTDKRDGKTYKTVKIGQQTWMAQNLNYQTPSGSLCYDNDNSNCDKCGRQYDWETAKKACPAGWHLPAAKEWVELGNSAGFSNWHGDATKLVAKNGWFNDCGWVWWWSNTDICETPCGVIKAFEIFYNDIEDFYFANIKSVGSDQELPVKCLQD
jgi:hypothetical protein